MRLIIISVLVSSFQHQPRPTDLEPRSLSYVSVLFTDTKGQKPAQLAACIMTKLSFFNQHTKIMSVSAVTPSRRTKTYFELQWLLVKECINFKQKFWTNLSLNYTSSLLQLRCNNRWSRSSSILFCAVFISISANSD